MVAGALTQIERVLPWAALGSISLRRITLRERPAGDECVQKPLRYPAQSQKPRNWRADTLSRRIVARKSHDLKFFELTTPIGVKLLTLSLITVTSRLISLFIIHRLVGHSGLLGIDSPRCNKTDLLVC